MASLGQELTERLRDSRFGREFFGPRIAAPTARWLQDNFVDHPAIESEAPAGASGETAEATALESRTTRVTAEATALDATLAVPDFADSDRRRTDIDGNGPGESAGADRYPSYLDIAKGLGERIKNHNLVVVAAGIAFWGLLAIPAILFAVVSVAGMVLDPTTVKDEVEENLTALPPEAREIIGNQLEGVSGGSTGGLIAGLLVGLLLAFWTSSGAVAKLMGALNTIYDTVETRNFVKLRGTALVLTLGGILFVSSAVFLLAAMPPLLRSIDSIGDSAATVFVWLRFPALGLVMVFALGVLYHLGPDRPTKYRPLSVGAAVAMVLWITLSGLFSIYTATVGNYNETYGSIGGIVILLLWLFITAFVVLLGAEIHSQRS